VVQLPADVERVLDEFAKSLAGMGVSGLYLGGSAAAGTYEPALSDLDLVAVLVDGSTPGAPTLEALHRRLSRDEPAAEKLHCAYVLSDDATDPTVKHLTWSHGQMHRRIVSGVARAELQTFGRTLFGPPPAETFPAVSADQLREAARGELTGYWRNAVRRRPMVWLDTTYVDLGLITLARADATLTDGTLISKREAIGRLASIGVPTDLAAEIAARRDGLVVHDSPAHRLRRAVMARSLMAHGIKSMQGSSGDT
jgi:Nucleotidyltransferase domain